jgi:hypothetical protein
MRHSDQLLHLHLVDKQKMMVKMDKSVQVTPKKTLLQRLPRLALTVLERKQRFIRDTTMEEAALMAKYDYKRLTFEGRQ